VVVFRGVAFFSGGFFSGGFFSGDLCSTVEVADAASVLVAARAATARREVPVARTGSGTFLDTGDFMDTGDTDNLSSRAQADRPYAGVRGRVGGEAFVSLFRPSEGRDACRGRPPRPKPSPTL